MKKILFISHESSRTGAPLMLMYLMEWLKINREDITFDLLTLKPGEIDSEYKKLAQQFFEIHPKSRKPFKKQLSEKVLKKVFGKQVKNTNAKTLYKIRESKYDIIYANSIVSVSIACSLKNSHSKIIAHIHEMKVNVEKYLPNLENLIPNIDHFIAASKIVKRDLNTYSNIPLNDISVVYEASKINITKTNPVKNKKFTVGASGIAGWRKGTDVFLQIANYMNRYHTEYEINFKWVGKIPKDLKIQIESDLEKMNLEHIVQFTGEQVNPYVYYQEFDIFLMTSREDPFPLVCIETGMMGKPILCFENATGTAEILNIHNDVIIPYLDIRGMSEQIIAYYNNPKKADTVGGLNRTLFSKFSPDIICPQIVAIINQTSI